MEGISKIIYHGKMIHVINLNDFGKSKEETAGLINAAGEEFVKNPKNSVLVLKMNCELVPALCRHYLCLIKEM